MLATDRRLEARLRTRPSVLTESDPLLSRARTPVVWNVFRGMLFVGFSHNLLLESYVSRMKNLERKHPGMHAMTLDYLLKHKVGQERLRAERRRVRARRGGGLRATALELERNGYGCCGTANDSKDKQWALIAQVERAATRHSQVYLRGRGRDSPTNQVKAARAAHDARKKLTAERVLASRRRTCARTRTGRERAIWTASECRLLLGVTVQPGVKVKKQGSNVWKDKAVLAAARVRASLSLHLSSLSLSLSLSLSAHD